eukprot:TRINITY_DN12704_c0_g2_i1.p1 TRINITY_DN12704_c0_g2~~TRINITY_DN12704_c0_g2_i1.p1  ORF type:complete len:425 (-),score=66.71 TRINITY_DN12704_c0_g2_i1:912-2186(-)
MCSQLKSTGSVQIGNRVRLVVSRLPHMPEGYRAGDLDWWFELFEGSRVPEGVLGRLSHKTGNTLHFFPAGGPFPERFRFFGLQQHLPYRIVDEIAKYLEISYDPKPVARQVPLIISVQDGIQRCGFDEGWGCCAYDGSGCGYAGGSYCDRTCGLVEPTSLEFDLLLDNKAVNWDVHQELQKRHHRRAPHEASSYNNGLCAAAASRDSDADIAFAAEAKPVIEEVLHDEPAAHISASEAAEVENELWAQCVQRLANVQILREPDGMCISDDNDEFDEDVVAHDSMAAAAEPKLPIVEASGSVIDIITFKCSTPRRQQWLLECRELEQVRAALERSGYDCCHDEACIFVAPCDLPAAREALRGRELHNHHVIISRDLRPLLDEAFEAGRQAGMLCSKECRVRGQHESLILQVLPQGVSKKNTFSSL